MNNIKELIAQLCPEGAEFRELGDVCLSVTAGGDLPENYKKGQVSPSNEYPYPIYSNGCDGNALYGFTDKYKISSEAVTISARGTIGFHTVRKAKFTPIVRLISLIPNKEMITTKFMNYILDITPIGGTSGSIPQLTVPNVKKISIPVPPLPIQQKVVNILDKFTALHVELQAELQARRAQYEYYRNELLNFDGKEMELKTLNKISTNFDSKRKPVTRSDRESGEYPYYGASGIVDYVSNYIFDGDFLLVSEDGANLLVRNTPIAFSISGKTWVNNHVHILKFDNYSTRRFVEIYLNSIDLSKYISGAAQPKLNQENLNKIPVPIPPLAEQERIVAILDQFDKLVNDLSVGLPAEIDARRTQYEYYRGRLLDFKSISNG